MQSHSSPAKRTRLDPAQRRRSKTQQARSLPLLGTRGGHVTSGRGPARRHVTSDDSERRRLPQRLELAPPLPRRRRSARTSPRSVRGRPPIHRGKLRSLPHRVGSPSGADLLLSAGSEGTESVQSEAAALSHHSPGERGPLSPPWRYPHRADSTAAALSGLEASSDGRPPAERPLDPQVRSSSCTSGSPRCPPSSVLHP